MSWSDDELARMERKINAIYSQYQSEVETAWNAYFDKLDKKLSNAANAVETALKADDLVALEKAQAEYKRLVELNTIKNKQFNQMVDNTAFKISKVNQTALDYVNDTLPSIYAFGYNEFEDFIPDRIKGYSFSLVDEATVKKLAQNEEILLPKKILDPLKDIPWNKKAINGQLIQSILQGESIPKMAKRLETVSNMNKVSAIRNARTMATSAENAGRLDSYQQATEDGLIMKKYWLAAHDARTRDAHAWAEADYVQGIDIDEPFELINPDGTISKLQYPADPKGHPCQVYNCRCTMTTKVVGYNGQRFIE